MSEEVEGRWRVIREGKDGTIHRLEVWIKDQGIFIVLRWDDTNSAVRKVVAATVDTLPKRVVGAFEEIDIQRELDEMDEDLLALFPLEEVEEDTMHQPIEDEGNAENPDA